MARSNSLTSQEFPQTGGKLVHYRTIVRVEFAVIGGKEELGYDARLHALCISSLPKLVRIVPAITLGHLSSFLTFAIVLAVAFPLRGSEIRTGNSAPLAMSTLREAKLWGARKRFRARRCAPTSGQCFSISKFQRGMLLPIRDLSGTGRDRFSCELRCTPGTRKAVPLPFRQCFGSAAKWFHRRDRREQRGATC